MTFPNPATILKEAVRGVPAVKYALGIAGIVSVIAIVTVGWKIDPLVAVLGTVVMLVLMTVLVIFARLSTTAAGQFIYAIQVFMWASLALTIAAAFLLFTSVFFHWPLSFGAGPYRATAGDKTVWDLEEKVNDVRGSWETVPEYGDNKKREVLERATKLGQALIDVDDKTLGPSGHVIKREFACYAFIMAAATETYQDRKAKFAQQATALCRSASIDLASLFASKNPNKNVAYTEDWAKREDQKPFVDYLSAMASCLEGTSTNNRQKQSDAIGILYSQVPTFYLEKYPPEGDWVLKQCVKGREAGNANTLSNNH